MQHPADAHALVLADAAAGRTPGGRLDPPSVTLVAAVARNGAIGRGNALLWTDPDDQRHFRRLTIGHPVVMGRRTWDSLPERFRPLPGRRNLVVTRDRHWQAPGAEPVESVAAAVERAAGREHLFVIGGAEIYALALPLADRLVLTEIDADLDGDTFFPRWDRTQFARTTGPLQHSADGVPYRFATYTRTPVR